jgi:hypothetical protein
MDAIDGLALQITVVALGLLTLWVTVVLLVTALCHLLRGRARLRALTLARRTMPAWLFRLLIGAVGASIVLAPATAGAAPAPLPPPSLPFSTSAPAGLIAAALLPAPALPSTPSAADQRAGGQPATVTVQPGDSLWSLAAAQLGAEATPQKVAQQWPRWWAANRSVIGENPGMIRPGQQLAVPGDGS